MSTPYDPDADLPRYTPPDPSGSLPPYGTASAYRGPSRDPGGYASPPPPSYAPASSHTRSLTLDSAAIGNFVQEFLGSFALIFAILTTASVGTIAVNQAKVYPLLGTFFVVLVVGVVAKLALSSLARAKKFQNVFNPSVVIGLVVAGNLKIKAAVGFIVAELLGGAVATFGLLWILPEPYVGISLLGAPGPASFLTFWPVVCLEAAGTGFLMYTVMGVTDPESPADDPASAIGNTLAYWIVITGVFTGGSLNQARSLTAMFLTHQWTDWPAYLIAPAVGAVVGALAYKFVTNRGPKRAR